MTTPHADVRVPSVFHALRRYPSVAHRLLNNPLTMASTAAAPRILIVDDEPEIRSFISDALGLFGYDVSAAADAEQAFGLAARTRFDLVVSDLRLPGIWGSELVAKLRSIDPVVPLVMLTGSGPEDDTLRRVREAGITVLHKPVQLPQLHAALTKAMEPAA